MPEKSFPQTTVYKLHQIVYILDLMADQILKAQLGISYDDFMLLNLIYNYPTNNQQQLSTFLRIGKSALSQRIAKLVGSNLINRKTDKDSRRENRLSLTKKGEKIILKAGKILSKNSDPIFQNLNQNNIFNENLDQILQNLNISQPPD
jgi:DNA-binding MarR family transcriptional regulator